MDTKLTLEGAESFKDMPFDIHRSSTDDDGIGNFYMFILNAGELRYTLVQNNSEERIVSYGHYYLCTDNKDRPDIDSIEIVRNLENYFLDPIRPTESEIQLFKVEKDIDYPIKAQN